MKPGLVPWFPAPLESIAKGAELALIELVPTLEHCIETTAKREFARVSAEYLERGGRDRALEEQAELLRMFLESVDFRELRRQSEAHLLNGRSVRFVVSGGDGDFSCEMKVE